MKRNLAILVAALVVAVCAVETTNAAVPMLMAHQGRLLDASDQPVNGTRNLTFRIFSTPTGGVPLWSESHLAVPVTNGLFNVTLGQTVIFSEEVIVTAGSGVSERYLEIAVEGETLSPRRRLTSSAYSVAASRVSGDVQTMPGEMSLTGMGGSTTATIRAINNPVETGSEVELADGNGSTTATIRAATPTGGQIRLGGMSGSTTGTIRMVATPDSVGNYLDHDDDGDGTLEHLVWEKVDNSEARVMAATDFDDDGVEDNSVEQVSNASKAYMAIKTKGTGAQRTTILTEASDSGIIDCSVDDDGDGTARAKGIIIVKANPAGSASSRLTFDTDDNGIADNEILDQVDSASVGSRWKGMSGSTTGTIRIKATPDSADGEISYTNVLTGVSSKVKERAKQSTCSSNLQFRTPTASSDVEDSCDATGAVTKWKGGLSGSTTGTIRMQATPDSTVLDLGYSGSTTTTIRLQASSSGTAHPIEHSSGAHLTVGGAWTNASDKNAKENFSEVDGAELLEKIEDLPITQWNYKSEDESVTHIGPTAQDFKALFGVGENDKSISTVDPSGIALAAIKELYKQLKDKDNELGQLRSEIAKLKKGFADRRP